ncbi:MAG: hypothetical protein H8E35_00505 [Ardenticatenia bacterium]|nr:hypothetical protein [Ardenticatenia bacterium]
MTDRISAGHQADVYLAEFFIGRNIEGVDFDEDKKLTFALDDGSEFSVYLSCNSSGTELLAAMVSAHDICGWPRL